MASNQDQDRKELLDALHELTNAVQKNSQKVDDSVKKQGSSREKSATATGKLLKGLEASEKLQKLNSVNLISTIKGMTSVRSMLGGIISSNGQLVKSLAQAGQLTRQNYSDTLEVFRGNNVSLTQGIAAFGDVVSMGMSRFGKSVLLMAGQLKVMGIQTKGLLQNIRFNTEVLGFSVESSREFAEQMASSALKFGTSVEGLVGAVNSMRKATMDVAAELGPTTARSVQVAAAMLGQGNNEMQAMLANFMTSLLSGTSGFIKAGMLGVTAGSGMSPSDIAQITTQALSRVGELAPTPGAGAQHVLAGFEQANILSRQDVVLSRMMGNDIKKLTASQLKESAENASRMSFEQSWQNALFNVQEFAMKAVVGIAEVVSRWGGLVVTLSVIAAGVGLLAGGTGIMKGLLGIKGVLLGLLAWTKVSAMSKAAGGGASAVASIFGGNAAALTGATVLRFGIKRVLALATGVAGLAYGAYELYQFLNKGESTGSAASPGSQYMQSIMDDDFIRSFKQTQEDGKKQRQDMIKIQEEQLGLMKGSLTSNPSESPLSALTAELSRNMLGINALVDMAGERTDLARRNTLIRETRPIGIVKPGG
mgnify:CR=1 FL=1|tara:strand:+ start:13451 stop:15229 length:1779 start_codon:yes stop_codon:yes gene_type:complete